MNKNSLKSFLFEISGEAARLAIDDCKGGFPDERNCSWYHGAWPALRVLDMVSNPYWHLQFFEDRISRASRESQASNALILGCADVSTAHLISECCDLPILVTDKCASPLRWVDLLAARNGANWKTKQLDATAALPSGNFDIILNDAFLTRFPDNEKHQLLQKISFSLSTKGVYLTSVRVADDGSDRTQAYMSGDDRRKWFSERAVAKFVEFGGLPGISKVQFCALVEGYMRSMASYRFRDESHLKDAFIQAGFKTVETEFVVVPGESEESAYFRVAAYLS